MGGKDRARHGLESEFFESRKSAAGGKSVPLVDGFGQTRMTTLAADWAAVSAAGSGTRIWWGGENPSRRRWPASSRCSGISDRVNAPRWCRPIFPRPENLMPERILVLQLASRVTPPPTQVLRFATALDRPPAGGFLALPRRFRLRRDPLPLPRLPSAHTCFAELLLPEYPAAAALREALCAALNEGGLGAFGLA